MSMSMAELKVHIQAASDWFDGQAAEFTRNCVDYEFHIFHQLRARLLKIKTTILNMLNMYCFLKWQEAEEKVKEIEQQIASSSVSSSVCSSIRRCRRFLLGGTFAGSHKF